MKSFTRLLFFSLILTILACLSSSCSKRENPIKLDIPKGTVWEIPAQTFNSLVGNVFDDATARKIWLYTPADFESARRKYPVLYFLHGFKQGPEDLIDIYHIGDIADELIAHKEIQPMLIVMTDGSNYFGGSFYTNSIAFIEGESGFLFGGKYEEFIAQELVAYVDSTYKPYLRCNFNPKGKPLFDSVYRANRGISGYDMGGYGAFKIALDYDSLFGSVSASNALLLPCGDGATYGILAWKDSIFKENKMQAGDSVRYRLFSDSLAYKPLTSLLFAMAAAFSPHPEILGRDTSVTFFTYYKNPNALYARGIDLPIDAKGDTVDLTWNVLWRANDLKDRYLKYLADGKTLFNQKKFYLDWADRHPLPGFKEQCEVFYDLLETKGIEPSGGEYSGYVNYPAGSSNFLYDRIRQILKFHSQNFGPPE
jgi:S-formylglutathione hydrolase FrmB